MEKALSIQSGLDFVIGQEIQNDEKRGPEKSLTEKLSIIFKNISVEPVFFLYQLPSVMAALSIQNLNLEKACRVNLQMNTETCDALTMRNASGYNATEEIQVQKLVASMNAWKNIIQSLLPLTMLLLLGSYSDRHKKRKLCIQLPIIGEMCATLSFIACTYFFYELPMECNAIADSVPPALFGGWFTFYMGVYSYISVMSTLETRTLRIGATNIADKVSFTIGIALSGVLYRILGFYGVFGLAIILYIIGITYTIFCLKEVPRDDVPKRQEHFLKDFFNFKHIMGTIRVAFKKGDRNRKKRVLGIMVLVMVIIGPVHGEISVSYLFVRYKFGWNEVDYSLFHTFIVVMHMIGTFFSLAFFSRFLKLDDTVLGMISNFSKFLACFVFAFAPNSKIFYLGAVVEMLNGTSFIAMRSIISKLVPPDELGKINSLFGVCEALMPLIYGPMYSLTYKMTINWLPGFFYILGGVLTLPSVFIFLWLYTEHKRDERELLERKEIEEKKPFTQAT
ncbi:uncharacterized protein LOC108743517 [Agrilus planipennis]|uniref:Uncharacterized protein LOC108743517 n=1 Tax=Agrilus planipennis TaxID=224129 RepID=A0A1W4XEM7_AGRPL|nr:uncharacterized protein LOC108743517 [Agrilus planipennis]